MEGNPSFLAYGIDSVVANDDGTVTFTLPDVRPSFLTELANTAFSITNADVVRANGGTDAADAAETDMAAEYLNQNSAGTGPYQLESWALQDETVLVRNPALPRRRALLRPRHHREHPRILDPEGGPRIRPDRHRHRPLTPTRLSISRTTPISASGAAPASGPTSSS